MAAMTSPRRLLKAAQRIHDRLLPPINIRVPELSSDGWDELQRLVGRLRLVGDRGWKVAVQTLREEANRCVRRLQRRIDDWLNEISNDRLEGPAASVREIHADLLALEAEFDDFEIDLKEGTLSAVTDPITLKGIELGRFEIVLRWDELDDHSPYEVVALDGQAAGFDSTTTHPHVRDDRLCEGEGQPAIRAALRTGRLFDFFVLVRQVLRSYNADSAYVPLEKWNGRECRDCGETVSDEESTCCERCDRDLCFECSETCSRCQRDCCADCRGACEACDSTFCDRCAEWCSGCSERFCPDCLHDGTCQACRKPENETDENVSETTTAAAETVLRADAALHPIGVGEAPVPA